ncbi:MGMT family protein [Acuticoccus sp.]|uniref:MGMT family protein n=1 Tax=Acuticoccus sp. TaxID=1904378 RepID=UPI003B5289FA
MHARQAVGPLLRVGDGRCLPQDRKAAVWRALLTLSYGTTTTYGALARAIGRPRPPAPCVDRLRRRARQEDGAPRPRGERACAGVPAGGWNRRRSPTRGVESL